MNTYKGIAIPHNLCDKADRYIKKVIDYLKKSNKLSPTDEAAIMILADSYNQYLKANEIVDREGMTIAGSRNTIVVHPAVRIAKDNKTQCIAVMQELGLTIKSRSKMNVAEAENESPLMDFLKNN